MSPHKNYENFLKLSVQFLEAFIASAAIADVMTMVASSTDWPVIPTIKTGKYEMKKFLSITLAALALAPAARAQTWQNLDPNTLYQMEGFGQLGYLAGEDINGNLQPPTASIRGGITAATAPTNQFQNGISTSGVPQFAQPGFGNLSGSATASQLPIGSASGTVMAGNDARVTNMYSNTIPSGGFSSGQFLIGSNGTTNLNYTWSNFLRGQFGEGLMNKSVNNTIDGLTTTPTLVNANTYGTRYNLGQFLGSVYNATAFGIIPDGYITFPTTITLSSGSKIATVAAVPITPPAITNPIPVIYSNGMHVGTVITALGLGAGGASGSATVSNVSGNTVTLSINATANETATAATASNSTPETALQQQPYGATMGGGADQTAAFQNAIQYIQLHGGGTLYLPQGLYYLSNAAVKIRLYPGVNIVGSSEFGSVFLNNDAPNGSTPSGPLITTWCSPNQGTSTNLLQNFSIRGSLDMTLNATSMPFDIFAGCLNSGVTTSDKLAIDHINMEFNGNDITVAQYRHVSVTNSIFRFTVNGVKYEDTNDWQFIGNTVEGTEDDAFAAHTDDNAGNPAASQGIVTDNLFEDTQGIDFQGGRDLNISNNTFRRMISYAIYISATFNYPEGNNGTEIGDIIANNKISDVQITPGLVRNQSKYGIIVTCGNRAAGTAPAYPGDSTASVPGTPDSAGNITPLYGALNSTGVIGNMYQNGSVGSSTGDNKANQLGCRNFQITHNTFVRTLNSTTARSSWSYGGQWALDHEDKPGTIAYGVFEDWDYPVAESDLSYIGIFVAGPMQQSTIDHNVINTGGPAIFFPDNMIVNGDLNGLSIDSNILSNCATAPGTQNVLLGNYNGTTLQTPGGAGCIRFEQGTGNAYATKNIVTSSDINVEDNIIDADDQFVARGPGGAASGGAWASSATMPCMYAPNISGIQWRDNSLKDCMFPIVPAAPSGTISNVGGQTVSDGYWHNTLYGFWTGTGWQAGNLGIGTLPAPSQGYDYIWEQANPASPGYGVVEFDPPTDAASIPTTGYWISGQKVQSTSTTVTSSSVPLYYLRKTTGSGNVSGTDWLTVTAPAS